MTCPFLCKADRYEFGVHLEQCDGLVASSSPDVRNLGMTC